MAASAHLEVGLTLGAAFLGNIISAIMFGLTQVQIYYFFSRSNKRETALRCIVAVLWVFDALHLIFSTRIMYFYLITNYANPIAIVVIPWDLVAAIVVTVLSDTIIRSLFCHRIWLLSHGNILATLCSAAPTVVVLGTGIAFAQKTYAAKVYTNSPMIRGTLFFGIGTAVVSDTVIAVILCNLLWKGRTGFRKTNSRLYSLIAYTINTGLLTTVCTVACIITYAVMPNSFVFVAIYLVLCKLYLNSLLAALNAREDWRERSADTTSVAMTVVGPSSSFADSSKYTPMTTHGDVIDIRVEEAKSQDIDPEHTVWLRQA